MDNRRGSPQDPVRTGRVPAMTPEDRENQLISAAVDLAEQQILAGTASAQVITHYLKLGSSREKLEQEKLKAENRVLVTKQELMEAEKRTESLIADALHAMRSYTGQDEGSSHDELEE